MHILVRTSPLATSRSPQRPLEERDECLGADRPVPGLDPLQVLLRQRAEFARACRQPANGVLEAGARALGKDERLLPFTEQLRHEADVGGDDGYAAGHCFEHRIGRAFDLGGADQHVDAGVVVRHVLVRDERCLAVGELLLERHALGGELRERGLQDRIDALEVLERGGPAAVPDPADADRPPGDVIEALEAVRLEQRQIDAVRQHRRRRRVGRDVVIDPPQPLGRHVVGLGQLVEQLVALRDFPLAEEQVIVHTHRDDLAVDETPAEPLIAHSEPPRVVLQHRRVDDGEELAPKYVNDIEVLGGHQRHAERGGAAIGEVAAAIGLEPPALLDLAQRDQRQHLELEAVADMLLQLPRDVRERPVIGIGDERDAWPPLRPRTDRRRALRRGLRIARPALLVLAAAHPVLDLVAPDAKTGLGLEVERRVVQDLARIAGALVVGVTAAVGLRVVVHQELQGAGGDLHAFAKQPQREIDVLEADQHGVVEAADPIERVPVEDRGAAEQERAQEGLARQVGRRLDGGGAAGHQDRVDRQARLAVLDQGLQAGAMGEQGGLVGIEQRKAHEMASEHRQLALDPRDRVPGEVDVVVDADDPIGRSRGHDPVAAAADAEVLAEFEDTAAIGECRRIGLQLGKLVRVRAVVADQHLAGEVGQVLGDRSQQPDRKTGAIERQERDRQVSPVGADVGAERAGHGIAQHGVALVVEVGCLLQARR